MAKGIYGLIGRKLGHSYSEMIHHALGCEEYKLYEVEPENLPGFFEENRIAGLNVTIPYKKDVIPYLFDLSEEAAAIGSVNTIAPDRGGRLIGFNTDAAGFDYMAAASGITFTGRKVIILGSGGASLAVSFCVKRQGASEVVVISRSGPDNYENICRHFDAEVIVNTTPVGMFSHDKKYDGHDGLSAGGSCGNSDGASDQPPEGPGRDQLIDLRDFRNCKGVIDLIYNPLRTDLILQAKALGIPATGGLPMLVAQASAAEECFPLYQDSVRTWRKAGSGFFTGDSDLKNEIILNMIRRDVENIVITGMPGCGKSTVASLISKKTGRKLIDTDAEIEKKAGKSIPDIFSQDGEDIFRDIESEVIYEVSQERGVIIATGGGAVLRPENVRALKNNGRIYYVRRSLDSLKKGGRPLSESLGVEAIYEARKEIYESSADVTVNNNRPPKITADAIISDFDHM